MWHLALRQISYESLRSCLTVFAIGASIAMILILRGFEQGLYVQSEKVVLDRGGQLIAAQQGVNNFLAVRSSLPQLTRSEVEAVDGVVNAHPLTGFWVIYGPEGNKFPLLLLVYDSKGGPTHLLEGRFIEDGRDIVVDIGLSKRFDLKPGDPLIVSDFEFRVFLLIDIESELDPLIVAERIELQVDTVDVFTPQELADYDVELGRELFGPIMSVLISLSYFIGLLVIGLIIYSDVATRRRRFAIMKALGFRLSKIASGAVLQTSLLVLLACPLGVLLAYVSGKTIERMMPVYLVEVIDTMGLVQTFFGVAIITLVACLLPLRIISRTDPVIVFQEE
jgi:ABC-type antimicrobial peptide transport system permease subunit